MDDSRSGAISEDNRNQAQTASALPAGQVAGNKTKSQPADAITNEQPTHDGVETTQAIKGAAPDASGDKSSSVSNEVDTAPTHETTPAKAVPDSESELDKDPASDPPPTDASAPPPVPDKDSTAIDKPTPASEETSASPSQTSEPAPVKAEDANKTDEPPAPPTKSEAPAPENAESSKPDAVEDGPKPQSGADGDNRAVDEESAARQDGDGKANGVTKLALRMDRVRELSTASVMSASSSAPGTPGEEAVSSAVDEDDGGAPSPAGHLTKNQKKRQKKKTKKGEKNSPRPPPGETENNANNSTKQDHKPEPVAATTIPSGEGEGELVEKVACGEEDVPVMVEKTDSGGEDSVVIVEKPRAGVEGEKIRNDTGSDEWADFADDS